MTAGEIVAQIMLVQKYFDEKGQDERVSHVVVMGIGEPFDNYVNLMNFYAQLMTIMALLLGHVILPCQPVVSCQQKSKNLQMKTCK